jgi:hypothetical protein
MTCWRMLVDRGGLWFRVLTFRYGVEGGRLKDRRQSGSSWWKEIAKIRDGDGGVGGRWFEECVLKKVGNGMENYFWTDLWVGGSPLCVRFRRLFYLAENRSSMVAYMFSLGWGEEGGVCKWRRRLRTWEEEMLGECRALLDESVLQTHVTDWCQWQSEPGKGYSVCGAYRILTLQESALLDEATYLIWHRQVSKKVSIFAWRLFCDRLPTKANFLACCVISPEVLYCVSRCRSVESALVQHFWFSLLISLVND